MTRQQIATATDVELDNRLDTITDLMSEGTRTECETLHTEYRLITKEQDARHAARHPDARVRQGMGER